MRKSIRPLIAMTAALALTVTAGMSALAQADNTDKHFERGFPHHPGDRQEVRHLRRGD